MGVQLQVRKAARGKNIPQDARPLPLPERRAVLKNPFRADVLLGRDKWLARLRAGEDGYLILKEVVQKLRLLSVPRRGFPAELTEAGCDPFIAYDIAIFQKAAEQVRRLRRQERQQCTELIFHICHLGQAVGKLSSMCVAAFDPRTIEHPYFNVVTKARESRQRGQQKSAANKILRNRKKVEAAAAAFHKVRSAGGTVEHGILHAYEVTKVPLRTLKNWYAKEFYRSLLNGARSVSK